MAVVTVVLFVFVVLYRFNTLGGSLAGFDDDHFVHFAYAKQVEAGEQPLRDFTGLGLQGAWPSLTYEISAAAQSLLGDNLRSEALLSVAGLAVGAVLAFWAAAFVAPIPWALAATLLGVFIAPKLYSYPKVLLLGAAAVGIAWFVRKPSMQRLAVLALITAASFLFRHDYAVYVGVGVVVACAAAAPTIASAVGRVFVYGLLTLVLLTPSLVFVQRHLGLAAYLRDCMAASKEESARTEGKRPAFTTRDEKGNLLTAGTFFDEESNAIAFLYFAHFVLPIVLLIALWRTRLVPAPEARPALVACAVMALFVAPFFLRGNTGARFGDMGPLFAVVVAGICALGFHRATSDSFVAWAIRAALLLIVLAATVASTWMLGGVTSELDASGWSDSLEKITKQAQRRWDELERLPAEYWSATPDTPSIAAVQYINRCTAPSDRVLMAAYQPEILPLADRRFAGGRANFIPELLTDEPHQQQIVAKWQQQSVPIVLMDESDDYRVETPIVYEHLLKEYDRAGTVDVNGGVTLTVFARRDRRPVAPYKDGSLPCFR
jgi:hypothetical protein